MTEVIIDLDARKDWTTSSFDGFFYFQEFFNQNCPDGF